MRDVVVLGVGLHKFGRFPEKGLGDFGREAGLAALKDAGVDYKDIEAGFCGRVYDRVYAGLRTFGELGLTGIPITNVELACASSSRAAMLAADAIAGGIYDLCLVIGAEKMARGMLGGGEAEPSYQMLMGLFIMPGAYAQMAQRHMHEYGTKPEHFAQVSVKSHKNAVHNPNAHYQAPLSLEEVMNSRMVADPITLYQCCPTSDGASAVVLASAEKARQYTSEPVYLKAWFGGTPMYENGEVDILEGPTGMLAQKCYQKAGRRAGGHRRRPGARRLLARRDLHHRGPGLLPQGRGRPLRLGGEHGDHGQGPGEHRRRPVEPRPSPGGHRRRHDRRAHLAATGPGRRPPGGGGQDRPAGERGPGRPERDDLPAVGGGFSQAPAGCAPG